MFDLIITFVLLASAITASKFVLQTIDASVFMCVRLLIGGLCVGGFALWHGRSALIMRVRRYWWQLLLFAAFATFIPAILKAYALKHTLSSKISLISSLDPFVTAFYCSLLFGQHLDMRRWTGVMLGFLGAIVLIVVPTMAESRSLLGPLSYAEIAALLHVFISRLGWIYIQRLLQKNVFSPTEINGVLMLCAGLYAVMAIVLYEPAAFLQLGHMDGRTLWVLAYSSIAANIVGYTLYSNLLKKHSATLVSLAGFLTPLCVYVLGWLVLGEQPYLSFIVAAAITFAGLALFYRAELKLPKIKKNL